MQIPTGIREYSKEWGILLLQQRKAELADMESKLSPEAMAPVLKQLWISEIFLTPPQIPAGLEEEIQDYYAGISDIPYEEQIEEIRQDLEDLFSGIISQRIPLEEFKTVMEIEDSRRFNAYLGLVRNKREERRKKEAGANSLFRAEAVGQAVESEYENILDIAEEEIASPERNDLFCMYLFWSAHATRRCKPL